MRSDTRACFSHIKFLRNEETCIVRYHVVFAVCRRFPAGFRQ